MVQFPLSRGCDTEPRRGFVARSPLRGSGHPELMRMTREGWDGRRALGEEIESWRRFAAGLEAVLRTM